MKKKKSMGHTIEWIPPLLIMIFTFYVSLIISPKGTNEK